MYGSGTTISAIPTPDDQGVLSVADAVAASLAYDEAVLREQLASAEEDAAVYRLIVVTALDALHDLTVKYRRVCEERNRLRDEHRQRREDRLIQAGIEDDPEPVV